METTADFERWSPKKLDETAHAEASDLVNRGARMTQIRAVYSAVQRMRTVQRVRQDQGRAADEVRAELTRHLIFFKPRLAYAAARHKELRGLQQFLTGKIDEVLQSSAFGRALENFFVLMESLVAYFYYEGEKSKDAGAHTRPSGPEQRGGAHRAQVQQAPRGATRSEQRNG